MAIMMSTPAIDDPLVPLRGGLVIRTSHLVWLLEAGERGLRFRVDDDGSLVVSPRSAITAADDAFLRRHRDALKAAVAYDADARPL
jgi:hypothetical protein